MAESHSTALLNRSNSILIFAPLPASGFRLLGSQLEERKIGPLKRPGQREQSVQFRPSHPSCKVILSSIDPEEAEGFARSAVLRKIGVYLFLECIRKPA